MTVCSGGVGSDIGIDFLFSFVSWCRGNGSSEFVVRWFIIS